MAAAEYRYYIRDICTATITAVKKGRNIHLVARTFRNLALASTLRRHFVTHNAPLLVRSKHGSVNGREHNSDPHRRGEEQHVAVCMSNR